jgi:Tol biopolymer transport system component
MRIRTRRWALLQAVAIAFTAAFAFAPQATEAQTPFAPYFGKNQIRYDKFEWFIYETDHFEIFYYPEIEEHLERMAGYAESAYDHVSSTLRHDLVAKIPLILFETSAEFQQQNVIPGVAQEGVGAFAEPSRHRIVMPLDEPPDLLYRLVVHELTHQFEFDIIPTSLIRRNVPLWINEGLSDYMTGIWQPLDLMMVRDAAVADIIPEMSNLEGYGQFGSPRMIYNLGHTVFEFIQETWGDEGLRSYLFSLRREVIGGGGGSDDAYENAFQISPAEFDRQFDLYLKARFRPFRDKEVPADYGVNLAPNPQDTRFNSALSVEPSPSGDLLAVVTGNIGDFENDIVLLSAQDGTVVRNLTEGFDKDLGFEFITQPGGRFNTVPFISWSPQGDQIAYFARSERNRSLILQDVLNRRIVQRVEMDSVDDPESPDISPDGRQVAFSALRDGVGDIFILDLQTREIRNVTSDGFGDYGPTWSPDGLSITYMARFGGYEKLFRVDVATGTKTQLTFGTHDDATAQFIDDDTIVFASTATDPSQTLAPEVARNGNVYNIWTLNLETGELRQYTDTIGGNTSPVVVRGSAAEQIAFISYYRSDWELHILELDEPMVTAASSDFGTPGPVTDLFVVSNPQTLEPENSRRKGAFERMFLDGRPPVNIGVTSGGDFFGGSGVVISDLLGDQQFSMYAESVSRYRSMSFGYVNLSRRFNYAVQAYSQTQFFYGNLENVFYDPSFSQLVDRDLAIATRSVKGATVFGIWPFDRYRRVEVSGSLLNYNENFNDPSLNAFSQDFQQQTFGRQLFNSGNTLPLTISFIQETTVFREFGPLAGNTLQLSYEISPKISENSLSRQTADLDARYYLRLGTTGLLAFRARGFKSWGDTPNFTYFGGNSEMRGYEYLEFIGDQVGFLNAELRFPLIEAMLTPIGIFGGVRGVFFANMGGAQFGNQDFKWFTSDPQSFIPTLGYEIDPFTQAPGSKPILGAPATIDGFRLVDARASYGLGLETFALGFPVHFDWAWRTLFNKQWEDALFAADGGSDQFRKMRFQVWIGYDF